MTQDRQETPPLLGSALTLSLQNFNHTKNVVPARTQETTLVSQVRPKEDGSIAEKGSLPTDWLL